MTISRDAFISWIKAFADVVAENKQLLTDLDSAIGDADHGANMNRGFQTVLAKLPAIQNQDIGSISKNVGMVLISSVGGASGPLYGTFFMQIGLTAVGKLELTLSDWVAALESAIDGIVKRGKASPGDKTMLDSLLPALTALKAAETGGASFPDALRASEKAAQVGMLATIPMIAKKGRASYLGERSIGTQDPGSTSSYLLIKAAADVWGNSN
jgi:dihydroxyacetone kinase-like protein